MSEDKDFIPKMDDNASKDEKNENTNIQTNSQSNSEVSTESDNNSSKSSTDFETDSEESKDSKTPFFAPYGFVFKKDSDPAEESDPETDPENDEETSYCDDSDEIDSDEIESDEEPSVTEASETDSSEPNNEETYNGPQDTENSVYEEMPEVKIVPPPKQGKGFLFVVASVAFVVSLAVAVWLTARFGKEGSDYENSSSNDLPTHEYTDKVIEHVKTEAPKNKAFESKTELYSEAEKSCVTVISKIKSNFYGQVTYSQSLGSGFVVSKDGYIVTNAHVVEGGTEFKVRFYNGKEADALLIGKETNCDLAVIKIRSSEELVPASIGDSSKVRVGDFAMAIGTPSSEDLFGTMTYGVISGLNRKIDVTNSAGQTVRSLYLLQTDATLNPGNSGGPLFNMYGQVIGINTMKLSNDFEGIGFAIPSAGAVQIINSLISTGEADYNDSEYVKGGAQIGIQGLTLTDEAKKEYGFADDAPKGVLVVSIEKSSSAYKAGVSGYDVICEFNNKEITTIEQLIAEIQKCSPGEEVSVKVYRVSRNGKEGKYHTYSFRLDAVKDE